jgi:hypothetical protein
MPVNRPERIFAPFDPDQVPGGESSALELDDGVFAGVEQLLHLRRYEAPAGFADRVAARLAEQRQAEPHAHRAVAGRKRRLPAWRRALAWRRKVGISARLLRLTLAAGLSLAIAVPGAWLGREHQREEQGRAAAQQFELALRLTQQHLSEAGDRASLTWRPNPNQPVEPGRKP